MLLILGLLLASAGFATAILVAMLRLRAHRVDELGRREPWKGPSPFAQTNLLTASNYDPEGRRKLRLLKVALFLTWLVFMSGLMLVVRSQIL
jgi:hypothetical protein